MTGIVGTTTGGRSVRSTADELYSEPWYERRATVDGEASIALVEHGDRDARANRLLATDRALAVVYGVVSNRHRLPYEDDDALFGAILDRPGAVLPRLEGPFTIACLSRRDDRVVLATDKAGGRPCFYDASHGLAFSTELSPLARRRDEVALDPQAVADLLSYGFVVGERTLVDGVRALPPASALVWDGETTRSRRYWAPPGSEPEPDTYADEWVSVNRRAMADVASTSDRLTLWLSGGLDSRAAAALLADVDADFAALTYRIGGQNDRDAATRVAETLDVPHDYIEGTGTEGTIRGIERGVRATDGMISWTGLANVGFTFDGLHDAADVVMEGGTFLGEDLWTSHLRGADSPVAAVDSRKRVTPVDQVRALLDPDVDPEASVREEVARVDRGDDRLTALVAMRQLYGYSHMRSNVVQRSQVGTRTVSHGPVLERVVNMPDDFRMRTIPLPGVDVPRGVPRIKLGVVRRLNSGLDRIPYERTGVAPKRPEPLHAVGFGVRQLTRMVSGPAGSYADRYRADERLRGFVDDALDDVRDRPLIDGDAVVAYRDRFRDGEVRCFTPLSVLSGLELWLRHTLD